MRASRPIPRTATRPESRPESQARRVIRLNDAQRAGYGLGFWTNDDGGFSKDFPREAFGFAVTAEFTRRVAGLMRK